MKIVMTVLAMSVLSPAHAADPKTEALPTGLRVPDGHKKLFLAHADGTQNYVCLPAKTGGFAWTLYGPDATLRAEHGDAVIGAHFVSPDTAGAAHPSWQGLDGSRAQGTSAATVADKSPVAEGAIPWLLLKVSGTTPARGKTAHYSFAQATYVQRIHTAGGVAPATGCAAASDVGAKSLVPYQADYVFFGP